MEITLFKNTAPKNRLNKTPYLKEEKKIPCLFKETTSLLSPAIVISGKLNDLCQYNYCFIGAFARCYFITKMESLSNNQIKIYLQVDALQSYRRTIETQKVIASRSTNKYNTYLQDDQISSYQYRNFSCKKFPVGLTSASYILVMSGVGGAAGN